MQVQIIIMPTNCTHLSVVRGLFEYFCIWEKRESCIVGNVGIRFLKGRTNTWN